MILVQDQACTYLNFTKVANLHKTKSTILAQINNALITHKNMSSEIASAINLEELVFGIMRQGKLISKKNGFERGY